MKVDHSKYDIHRSVVLLERAEASLDEIRVEHERALIRLQGLHDMLKMGGVEITFTVSDCFNASSTSYDIRRFLDEVEAQPE